MNAGAATEMQSLPLKFGGSNRNAGAAAAQKTPVELKLGHYRQVGCADIVAIPGVGRASVRGPFAAIELEVDGA